MDLGTVIGIVLIFALLLGSMVMGVGIGAYIDIPSALIVIGGSIGALMIAFKPAQMKQFTKIFMKAIKPGEEDIAELIKKMVEFATKARKDGILALEGDVNNEENEFLKKGLSMAIDGSEPDTIRDLLEIEMEQTSTRHKIHGSIFNQWAGLAGAMGMIGTLVGLVAMLANLADPSAVGPAMAVALLTTMYGALIGTAIAGIIESKLEQKHSVEMIAHQITIQGAIMIAAGESIGNIKMKLQAVLPPEAA